MDNPSEDKDKSRLKKADLKVSVTNSQQDRLMANLKQLHLKFNQLELKLRKIIKS